MNIDNEWYCVNKSTENKIDKLLDQLDLLTKKVEVLTDEVSRLRELDIREKNLNVRRRIPFRFTPQYTGISSTYLKNSATTEYTSHF